MKRTLVISACDNVATALDDLDPGTCVDAGGRPVRVVDRIPRGHKLALQVIAAGEAVIKYGSPIGTASTNIRAGAHVHIHNVASARGRGDLAARAASDAPIAAPRIAEPPDVVADHGNGDVAGPAVRNAR